MTFVRSSDWSNDLRRKGKTRTLEGERTALGDEEEIESSTYISKPVILIEISLVRQAKTVFANTSK